MKYIQRIFSFVISTALACGLVTNAFAATGTAKAAAPVPAITLTADNNTVSVGDTITISMAVDGTKNGFAALRAFLNYNADAFSPRAVTSIDNTTAKGFSVTEPTVSTTGLSALVLDSTKNLTAAFNPAATYTFNATQAGTFDFSVSGSVSAVDYTASKLDEAFKISVTVSAKPLTVTPVQNTTLSAEYGHTMGDLADSIQPKDFVLKSGDTDVTGKVTGKWSAKDPDAIPAAGTTSATFLFTPENSKEYSTAEATFALEIAPKTVTPKLSVKPDEKMYDGSTDLTTDQKATITLDGVIPADEGKVSATIGSKAYDAADCSSERTITASGIALTGDKKDNYKLSTDPCTAKGIITPYTGKVTVQKNIAFRSYDGERHPLTNEELTLTDEKGKELTLDTDYTVSYSEEPIGNQENDVSITYTLSGKGNYKGCAFTEKTGSFTILKRPMPNASGSLQDASFTIGETGETYKPQEPGITVTGKDGKPVAGSISLRYKAENSSWTADVPKQPGKYSIGAYFKSDDAAYSSGMLENVTAATLTVYKTLNQKDFTLDKTEFTYSGEQQQPAVSSALSAETDYTVSVSESVNAGDYKIKVEGKGYYKGEVPFDYTIAKAAGSGSVTMEDYTYGGTISAPKPTSATNDIGKVSYTYKGREGTEYNSQERPTVVGKYTVTAVFDATENAGKCSASADFEVKAKGIVAGDFTMDKTEFTYDGNQQQPKVNAAGLDAKSDYTVSYPKSEDAGTYKVTVTGKGNYSGTVELSYKINPAVYTLPEGAVITTELETYPVSIYGGQPLSHIGLKAAGLPEGAQFGWKAGDTKLDPNIPSYDVTVKPNSANYTEGTVSVSVKTVNTVTPAQNDKGEVTVDTVSGQLSTYLTAVNKTTAEQTKLGSNVAADIAKLTLSDKLPPKEQDNLKSAHLSDTALLAALDKSAENVNVSTLLNKGEQGEKSALTGLEITTGGKAALGADSGTATYTAKDITPEKPADGQLIEVELSLGSGQQPAVPVLVNLSFHAKNADQNGKFQVVHKHTENDPRKNFTTQYDCQRVSKSGDTVTVQFLAASFSSFSIQYTAPASGGSSSPSATPKPDEPQPQPTAAPALTASETTWLGGYGALLNAKSGTALSLDVTACEYLPGYIITGVQKSGVTLNLSTPAGKLCLSPAVAKAMNGSYNYTFADALAIAGKVAAAAKPAASPAPVKDPTAASPTPAPTPVPTAAPQPTLAPAPQPEAEPQEKSHSPLPMVAAVLVAAALLAGGYLAYNSASRRKAMRDVYAPSKKVKLNQNQNNGLNRK